MSDTFKVNITNAKTGAIGQQISSGIIIAPPANPINFQVTNLSVPTGHGWNFFNQVDDGPIYDLQNFAFLFNKRNGMTLANGPHTLRWNEGTGTTTNVLTFTIAPPVQPTTQIGTGAFGTNFDGATDPTGDPIAHPENLTAQKSIKSTWQRNWDVGSTDWTINKNWKAAGFNNGLQIQMPGKMMFADFGVATTKRVIASGVVDAAFLGNEFNTFHLNAAGKFDLANPGNYFGGTDAQSTQYCQTSGPLYIAAKILPVAPSRVNDLPGIISRYKSGAYGPIKATDLHLYSNDENWLVSQIQQSEAFRAATGVTAFMGEWNLRMNKGETLAQWGVRVAKVLQALMQTGIIALHFSGIPTGHPDDDVTATLDGKYQPLSLPIFKSVLNP